MLATVYIYLKKSALFSLAAALIILLDFDARAGWVVPSAFSLLSFAFGAGCVYMAVKKDLANYKEFKDRVTKELDENEDLRVKYAELKKDFGKFKEDYQPDFNRYTNPRRRWRENEGG